MKAGLFVATMLLMAACAPEQRFDNVCDPLSTSYDPCACLFLTTPCPLGTQCQVTAGRAECVCPTVWCPADGPDRTCCAPKMVCKDGACCMPSCKDKECGFDQCGLPCGTLNGDCPCGHECTKDQRCVFVACNNRECGPDGCGGTCGECKGCGVFCSDEGRCEYDPCHGIECGKSPCLGGPYCGDCPDGQGCVDGKCVSG